MSEKIVKLGIVREPNYLYYIDKNGDLFKTKAARGKKGSKGKALVEKLGIKKQTGYIYFLDKDGDVSCAKMKRWKTE